MTSAMSFAVSARSAARRPQSGQAMLETMLVTASVCILLFLPFDAANNMSVADYLARAVRSFFRGYSFLVSVY